MRSFKIVIAASSDVIPEIRAVESAVQGMNQKYRDRLSLSLYSWARSGAPSLQRGQETAFEDIDFNDADYLVVLLWSRMGMPTGAIDPKTGQEFAGGVMEELDRAVQLLQDSGAKLKRAMLYQCNRELPAGATEEQLADRRRVVDYCRQLQARDRFVLGQFTEGEDLRSQIINHFERILLKESPIGANVGSNAWMYCDRAPQMSTFENTVSAGSGASPVAYLIAGHDRDRPSSLTLRCAAQLGRSGNVTRPKSITLDVTTIPGQSAEMLGTNWARRLIGSFDSLLNARDVDLRTLLNTQTFRNKGVVILDHVLRVKKATQWNPTVVAALQWYLTQFWGSYSASKDREYASAILFITIACADLEASPQNGDIGTLETIERDLARIASVVADGCRRVAMPTLPLVEESDVFDWFRENEIYSAEPEWREAMSPYYGDPLNFVAQPMGPVEDSLLKIHRVFVASSIPRAS